MTRTVKKSSRRGAKIAEKNSEVTLRALRLCVSVPTVQNIVLPPSTRIAWLQMKSPNGLSR